MINTAALSCAQKDKLQRLLQMNKPITYGIIEAVLGLIGGHR